MNNSKKKNEKKNNGIINIKYEKIWNNFIKKLNFDLCDSIKETETIKKIQN